VSTSNVVCILIHIHGHLPAGTGTGTIRRIPVDFSSVGAILMTFCCALLIAVVGFIVSGALVVGASCEESAALQATGRKEPV